MSQQGNRQRRHAEHFAPYYPPFPWNMPVDYGPNQYHRPPPFPYTPHHAFRPYMPIGAPRPYYPSHAPRFISPLPPRQPWTPQNPRWPQNNRTPSIISQPATLRAHRPRVELRSYYSPPNPHNFETIRTLGKGIFGTVYLVAELQGGFYRQFALKKIKVGGFWRGRSVPLWFIPQGKP